LACELYNALRWADAYFREGDGRWLTRTELRQLAPEEAGRGLPGRALPGSPTGR